MSVEPIGYEIIIHVHFSSVHQVQSIHIARQLKVAVRVIGGQLFAMGHLRANLARERIRQTIWLDKLAVESSLVLIWVSGFHAQKVNSLAGFRLVLGFPVDEQVLGGGERAQICRGLLVGHATLLGWIVEPAFDYDVLGLGRGRRYALYDHLALGRRQHFARQGDHLSRHGRRRCGRSLAHYKRRRLSLRRLSLSQDDGRRGRQLHVRLMANYKVARGRQRQRLQVFDAHVLRLIVGVVYLFVCFFVRR